MIDPVRTYEYLARARAKIFDWSRGRSEAEWSRECAIGLGTLARTLTHIMICEWFYVRRMQGDEVPHYKEWPIQDENPPRLEVIERWWHEQEPRTRAAMAAAALRATTHRRGTANWAGNHAAASVQMRPAFLPPASRTSSR